MVDQNNAGVNSGATDQVVILEDGRVLRLNVPPVVGQEAIVDASAVQSIEVGFPAENAQVEIDGNDLVFKFENGSATILKDFTAQDPMPQIIMPDGTVVAGNIVVAQILSSDDVLDFETAAGADGASGGGSSAYGDDMGDPLGLLDPGGLLDFSDPESTDDDEEDFTAAAEGVFAVGNSQFGIGEAALASGPGTINGSLNISGLSEFGGVVRAAPNFSATGSLFNGSFQTGGKPIDVEIDGNVFTGKTPDGDVVFTMTINPNGTFNFVLNEPLDHGDPNNPADVINLNFTYVVELPNGNQTTGTLRIGVVDQAPEANPQINVFDENDGAGAAITGQLTANFGADGAADMPFRVGNEQGNSVWSTNLRLFNDTVRSGGEPVSIGIEGDSYVGRAGGEIVFTLQINPDGSYIYTQYKGIDHNHTSDVRINFLYSAVDGDGDATAQRLTISIRDGQPQVEETEITVAEGDDLGSTLTGLLSIQAGVDGIAGINARDQFSADGSLAGGQLTSGGVAVLVAFDAATNSFTGTADGETVFTFVLNQDGTYAFTLNKPLDHADGNDPADELTLHFGYEVVDGDGDAATGTITVTVQDDAPVAVADVLDATITDTQLIVGGNILDNDSFGADGGSLQSFEGQSVPATGLTIQGQYGVLTILPNGDYSYELTVDIAHADDPTPVYNEQFNYTIVDGDGDTSSTTLTLNVTDTRRGDIPEITGGTEAEIDETGLPAAGFKSVSGMIDVDYGADNQGAGIEIKDNGGLDGLTSRGVPVVVTLDVATGTYTGTANGQTIFTMLVNPDGSYEYKQFAGLDHPDASDPSDTIILGFAFDAVDSNGDRASGQVLVTVIDDGPVAVDDVLDGAVNDNSTALTFSGNILANDDFGADGGSLLSFAGQSIPVGGLTVAGQYGTLLVQQNGDYTYTFTQEKPAVGTTDVLYTDDWTYTIQDGDGDTATATLTVNITDSRTNDVPVITGGTSVTIDETGLVSSKSVSGQVQVDWGADGAGANIEAKGTGDLNGLTSGGVAIVMSFNAATGTYTGTANGQTIFTMQVNANGSYTFIQFKAVDHPNQLNPNDAFDISFDIKAVDGDGDKAVGQIKVTILDDGPVAVNDVITETVTNNSPLTFSGNILANDDFGADGGELFTFSGQSIPAGGLTLDGQYGTIVLQQNGDFVYTLTAPKPASGGGNAAYSDVWSYAIRDGDGDRATATLTINITDNRTNDVPEITGGTSVLIDETGLVSSKSVSGQVQVDWGADGAGAKIEATGNYSLNNMTSGGVPVVVAFNPATNLYTGTANGTTVFTMAINANGSYTFKQFKAIDHPNDLDPNDPFNVGFGIRAVDGTGDITTGQIQVTILDDGPSLTPAILIADETDMGQVYTGQIDVSGGADGLAYFGANGSFSVNGMPNLTSGGVAVNVVVQGNSYFAMKNGQEVFRLTFENDGTYKFHQSLPIDHPNANDPNDSIVMNFGIKAIDGDGDTATATITVSLLDDGPSAVDDFVSKMVKNDDLTLTGNILANDDFGADGQGGLLTFAGQSIPAGGLTVVGQYGTITIQQNGNFSYQLTVPAPASGAPATYYDEDFSYTIVDGDGDQASAALFLNVQDGRSNDVPVITGGTSVVIDETGLGTGKSVSGQVQVDWGADNVGATIEANGASNLQGLTSGGQPIAVVFDAKTNTYTGQIQLYSSSGSGSVITVFTMKVNANGTYTFNQLKAVDHPNASNPNDAFDIFFGVKATDGSGDSANGQIKVTILDDGPTAANDVVSGTVTNSSPVTFSGNVLANDDFGSDGRGGFTFAGQQIPNGGLTVSGQYGTLTIQQNGNFVYTLTAPKPGAGQGSQNYSEVWNYKITDGDGDTATANLTLNITDSRTSSVPIITGGTSVIIDETGLVSSKSVSGKVQVDWGVDAAGAKVAGDGSFDMKGLTSGGTPVTVTYNANNGTYTGKAGGVTVFTMKINADATYTFKQFKAVDHPNNFDPNDAFDVFFGFQAIDGTGDKATGQIKVTILDDGPIAVDDYNAGTLASGQAELVLTGNILANDSFGADGGWILTFGGQQMPSNGGPLTFQGQYGVFTLHANGDYSYQVRADGSTMANGDMSGWAGDFRGIMDDFPPGVLGYIDTHLQGLGGAGGTASLPDQLMESISYTIRDGDGDRATATLTVTVDNHNNSISGTTNVGGGAGAGAGGFLTDHKSDEFLTNINNGGGQDMTNQPFEIEIVRDYQAGDAIDLSHLVDNSGLNANSIANFVQFDQSTNSLLVDDSGQGSNYSKVAEFDNYGGDTVKVVIGQQIFDIASGAPSGGSGHHQTVFTEFDDFTNKQTF